MQTFLINSSIGISIGFSLLGILVAIILAFRIRSLDSGNERMRMIAGAIEEGAKAYLNRQLVTILGIAAVLFLLIGLFKNWWTASGFLLGSFCSYLAGLIGMRVAVQANVRTAQAATQSKDKALHVSFLGGSVTGLLVVGLALFSVGLFYALSLHYQGVTETSSSLVGLALGASLISVFARLGGGIYTKAADVGADLTGKIEQNLNEDDPRNPATIADNVGDNVGDCAGMAADVFETYVVSLIGAVLVAVVVLGGDPAATAYPFLVGMVTILGALSGIFYVSVSKAPPAKALLNGVMVNGVVSSALFLPLSYFLFPSNWLNIFACSVVGVLMTAAIFLITDYYTATTRKPVQIIAHASQTGHATNIIAGLATGMEATALPVLFIGAAVMLTYWLGGLYGVAIAVRCMLSMAGIVISLDAFGPITDNAGGIVEMSQLPKSVRQITDELDAVGNTMKAVTKGYAIGSAGLAALVLFGSYVEELKHFSSATIAQELQFKLQDPKVIIGLFIGGLLPYLFAARSMSAVGRAAGSVVQEVRRQIREIPGILKGVDRPQYGRCVDIVTKAALKEMIFPAILPLLAVLGIAIIPGLGPVVLGGALIGTIVTGLFVAISMTSGGAAWDNAKKWIEEGNFGGKGSEAHAAAVTGDTVGDPYKDTAGPAINPMIKVVNVLAILIIPIFAKYWHL
ncbi:pyrophosphatase [Methylacidiphilum kamchatkense Kam1]|uniref:K(+)-insensitive pyrophosphate-energized proton pump n=1 Tax=Methylacidiphilum kamchatkense Kam1 TaxID=1202785 RepID=A0A0C1URE0_9BACT|nr:sodium-translocating pyrophosphatase [Methylacidiphilum kamchatkense]KIE58418.1 pyrophosphatase [Methylacidiphilum kamchatkense Kam1]QDQ43226.1 K(+)-stimulated pyrophosphate-energized sodium pump [Methylacidiphilum kamchatkense Kam1]